MESATISTPPTTDLSGILCFPPFSAFRVARFLIHKLWGGGGGGGVGGVAVHTNDWSIN